MDSLYLKRISAIPPELRRIIESDDVELTLEEERQLAAFMESRKTQIRRARERFEVVTGQHVLVEPPTLPE